MAKSKNKMPKYPDKPAIGREPELTPEVQEKIVKSLLRGNYFETACASAGIHKSTAYRWLKRGARAERKTGDDPTGMYQAFCDAVEKAEADAEENDLLGIEAAGHGRPAQFSESGQVIREEIKPQWTALAWRLERKHPKKWGRTDKHEHTGKDGGPITFADWIKGIKKPKDE